MDISKTMNMANYRPGRCISIVPLKLTTSTAKLRLLPSFFSVIFLAFGKKIEKAFLLGFSQDTVLFADDLHHPYLPYFITGFLNTLARTPSSAMFFASAEELRVGGFKVGG